MKKQRMKIVVSQCPECNENTVARLVGTDGLLVSMLCLHCAETLRKKLFAEWVDEQDKKERRRK